VKRIDWESSVELQLKDSLGLAAVLGAGLGILVVVLRKGGKKVQRIAMCRPWAIVGEVTANWEV